VWDLCSFGFLEAREIDARPEATCTESIRGWRRWPSRRFVSKTRTTAVTAHQEFIIASVLYYPPAYGESEEELDEETIAESK
jgi:hypothetical protein